MNLISFYEHVRCGLWASSGPFPLSAHYGLYKRGRDPPTNPSSHLKKERSDLPLKWLLKEGRGRSPTAAAAAAAAACLRAAVAAATTIAATPCPGHGSSPLSLRCRRPQAAAAASGPPRRHHLHLHLHPHHHHLHLRQASGHLPASPNAPSPSLVILLPESLCCSTSPPILHLQPSRPTPDLSTTFHPGEPPDLPVSVQPANLPSNSREADPAASPPPRFPIQTFPPRHLVLPFSAFLPQVPQRKKTPTTRSIVQSISHASPPKLLPMTKHVQLP